MNTQIIAIANQRVVSAKQPLVPILELVWRSPGKKVLLIDGDPQGSLTISLGNPQPVTRPLHCQTLWAVF